MFSIQPNISRISVGQSTKSYSKENSERTTQSQTSMMSPATQARESLDGWNFSSNYLQLTLMFRRQQELASVSDRMLLIAVLVILFFWALIQVSILKFRLLTLFLYQSQTKRVIEL